MNFKRWTGGTIGLLAIGSLAWGCSNKADDCNANQNCGAYDGGAAGTAGGGGGASGASGNGGSAGTGGSSGKAGASSEAGSSGDAGAAGAPATCDGTLSPDADGCVISDEYGLFVSPDGDDTAGKGTIEKPYATLTKALASVGAIKRIYVCAADYSEANTLAIPSGVSIFGGFSCAGGKWVYDQKDVANVAVHQAIGVDIESANDVTLQDLAIKADDAASPGASSFGAMVVNSMGVLFKGVTVQAGKGAAGSKGADGDPGMPGTVSGTAQNGVAGTCTTPPPTTTGAPAVAAICDSQGGKGGDGVVASSVDMSQNGQSGFPKDLTNFGAAGATPGASGIGGTQGSDGATGIVGGAAQSIGAFTATGFMAANGSPGTAGKPGQGGGGGGSSTVASTCVGSSGGAGGMGGCGGQPGLGGMGGGASIALMSWKSVVTLDGGALISLVGGAGGDGGTAGLGGGGQSGGNGGSPNPPIAGVKSGGSGGKGGDGGDGGSGAGGTGGPSFALIYKGTEPTKADVTLTHAPTGGAKGAGPHLSTTESTWAPDGSVGQAADEYPIP